MLSFGECLTSKCLHETLDLILSIPQNLVWRHMSIILPCWSWRQEDQKFSVIVGYIVNSGPAWAT